MMNGDWGSSWMGMGFGGVLVMLLFWGLAIVGLVALIRWLLMGSQSPPTSSESGALETLRRRYATGELDWETYQEVKKELQSGS